MKIISSKQIFLFITICMHIGIVISKNEDKYSQNNNNNNNNKYIATSQLDTDSKTNILSLINYKRSNVQPTSSDMRFLNWSPVLETMATYSASQCEERMEGARECNGAFAGILGFAPYITNPDTTTFENIVDSWFDSTYYMYECNQCYADEPEMCEKYTQVSHSNVTAVGCATSLCYMNYNDGNNNNNNNNNNNDDDDDNAQIGTTLVCYFTPGYLFDDGKEDNNDNNNNNNNNNNNGYEINIAYPYMQGDSCSKCNSDAPFCIDGLCATWEDVFSNSSFLTRGSYLLLLMISIILFFIVL